MVFIVHVVDWLVNQLPCSWQSGLSDGRVSNMIKLWCARFWSEEISDVQFGPDRVGVMLG